MNYHFENYVLDSNRRELLCGSKAVALEPQVFDLLVYLLQNRERVVSKDDLIEAVWGGRIVSDSTLTSRINAARKAVGDSGEQQKVIRTFSRKGIRFVGAVHEPAIHSSEPNVVNTNSSPREPIPPELKHEIRFCTAPDGIRLAYAEVGTGPPLVKAANWLNHLEYDWESPIWSHLLREFAAEHRLIRYDARGNGLSDWEVDDISFEASVRDLESVVDAAGLDKFALLGISQGCAASIAYAVGNPGRVTHLVLYGGFARGRRQRESPKEVEFSDALLTLIRQGWGQENSAFRQIWTSLFIPGGTAEQMQWFNDLQRKTASPENAARIRLMADNIEINDLLNRVNAPTLVLHCRDDGAVPFEEGRRLAAGNQRGAICRSGRSQSPDP